MDHSLKFDARSWVQLPLATSHLAILSLAEHSQGDTFLWVLPFELLRAGAQDTLGLNYCCRLWMLESPMSRPMRDLGCSQA